MDPWKKNDELIVNLLSRTTDDPRQLKEAARILYGQYLPSVYAFLKHRMGIISPALLENIGIETITRATRLINKFDPVNSRFKKFLSGIARNIAYEMLRRELKTIRLDDVDEKELCPASSAPPHTAELLYDVLHGQYAPCLASLDEQYRVLIEMALAGLPPEEYQNQCGITSAAYRKRKERAIKLLRARIASASSSMFKTK